jgi:hypothetical protein
MDVQLMDWEILTGFPFGEPLSATVVVEEHVFHITAGSLTTLLF